MSTTAINFNTVLKLGGELVPLASEIVVGDNESSDGVTKGFLFKLDLKEGEGPVTINLGAIIGFIEDKLGAGSGSLMGNSNLSTMKKIFPDMESDGNPFSSQNDTLVNVKAFSINSTKAKFLFSINVDIQGSDPSTGLITFPEELSSWLKIDNLAISFSATS
jgi:hypothetical protein